MARRREAKKREVAPDPKFKSVLVSKFINNLMKAGKKSVAQRLFYESLKILEQRSKQPALEVFEKAIENAKPLIEVKSRRVGGATYQVPVEVRPR
ncbi:MAG: 30S ribosomal protein S7, partial [Desulfatiglandales bacterium]